MAQPPTDLQIAVSELTVKKFEYDRLWRYYDGDTLLAFSQEDVLRIFGSGNIRISENWCSVVVNSVLDRMELRTPVVSNDDAMTATLRDLWEMTGLIDDEYSIHEDIAVTGETFVIAWPDDDGNVQAFHNDARLCHVEYDKENPHRIRFGSKWWATDDGVRLTLYYPDRLEYYVTKRTFTKGETPEAKAFEPLGEEPIADNPYGMCMFHFRSNRRKPISQLNDAWPIQDMVNDAIVNMVIAGKYGAFPQRFVISTAGITGLKSSPGTIWDLVAADKDMQATAAGQFQAADLSNYTKVIDRFTTSLGAITRTPKHYFFSQGGDPSGEALITMESPLNKKVARLEQTLTPTWRDLAAFLLLLNGTAVASQDIEAEYMPSETQQPRTTAEIRELSVRAGMPLTTTLRDEGWTDEQLAQMDADKEAERVQSANYADAVLGQAQRNFDGGAVG